MIVCLTSLLDAGIGWVSWDLETWRANLDEMKARGRMRHVLSGVMVPYVFVLAGHTAPICAHEMSDCKGFERKGD